MSNLDLILIEMEIIIDELGDLNNNPSKLHIEAIISDMQEVVKQLEEINKYL